VPALTSGRQFCGHAEKALPDLGVETFDRGLQKVNVTGGAPGAAQFDLTRLVRDGVTQLTVTVFNTLGPMLDDTSPTAGVYAGQRISGWLGPRFGS
jgi:hypothetical protein